MDYITPRIDLCYCTRNTKDDLIECTPYRTVRNSIANHGTNTRIVSDYPILKYITRVLRSYTNDNKTKIDFVVRTRTRTLNVRYDLRLLVCNGVVGCRSTTLFRKYHSAFPKKEKSGRPSAQVEPETQIAGKSDCTRVWAVSSKAVTVFSVVQGRIGQ